MKRILFAAPKSGSGKTLLTCAFLTALKEDGKKVAAFKCGPDYIDPMFHKSVIGIPSKNLDSYFVDEKTVRQLFFEAAEDKEIAVIEGVMGLYDGLGGIEVKASSYDIACITKTPIVLVVDANGMGASLIALLRGFLTYDTKHLIKGVILNKTTKMFCELIKPEIERETGLAVLGYFPKQKEPLMESRHLGLVMPDEIPQIKQKLHAMAEIFRAGIDMEEIFRIAQAAERTEETWEDAGKVPWQNEKGKEPVKIGVAYDEAACFYYEDNLNLLRKFGAEPVFFSLLKDKTLPDDISGLILGGGYPELHVKELSENSSMVSAVRQAILEEMPTLAECGGFMYLHESVEDLEKNTYPMAGIIPGKCYNTGKLVRFGYAEFTLPDGTNLRGHEFHYYDSTNNGSDVFAKKPVGKRSFRCMHKTKHGLFGFPHFYYYSNPAFVQNFVTSCRAYQRKRK